MISYPPDRHPAPLVENRLRFDIRRLIRDGHLDREPTGLILTIHGGRTGALVSLERSDTTAKITFFYERAGTEHLDDYEVALEKTPCPFGYFRFWWRCPGCQRRCAVLYWPDRLECRVCHGLVYRSQSLSALERQLRKASAVRRRFGGSGSFLEPFPIKPKGMHWSTYERLLDRDASARHRLGAATLARIPAQEIEWHTD